MMTRWQEENLIQRIRRVKEEMSDAEIERLHGDDKRHPIAKWRKEIEAGETTLPYIDWRADRKFYQRR